MTTTSLRTAVKARLVEVFHDALPGVQVLYSVDGKTLLREAVVLFGAYGANDDEPSAMTGQASRKPSFDTFEVEGVCVARQLGQTAQAAEERAEELYDACKNALVDPSLAGPNLYGAGTYEAIDGLIEAWMRPTDLVSGTDEHGWAATFSFAVRVKTRLT